METVDAGPGAERGTVQVKFSSKDPSFSLEPRPLLVPTSLKRYGLSEIINHLLESETPVPFSFLIGGELLGASIDDYLTKKGLSSESQLEIEYIRSILPPSFLASYPHEDWISSIRLSSADIVTGSYDSILRIWDHSQTCRSTGAGHTGAIKAIAITDEEVVSASMDRTLRLWNRSEGSLACKAELRGHKTTIETCDLHDNNIISGSADGMLGIWSTTDELGPPHTSERLNRRKRVRGSGVGVLRPRHLYAAHNGQIGQVAYNPTDPSTVYSASWDHTLVTTDLNTLMPLSSIKTTSPLFSLLPFGHLNAVLTGGHRNIHIHDLRSSSLTSSTLQGHSSFVSCLAKAPAQEYLFASASYDGDVRIWDLRNERSLYSIKRNPSKGTGTTKKPATGPSKILTVAWGEIGIVSGGEECQLQINKGVDHSSTGDAKI